MPCCDDMTFLMGIGRVQEVSSVRALVAPFVARHTVTQHKVYLDEDGDVQYDDEEEDEEESTQKQVGGVVLRFCPSCGADLKPATSRLILGE